MKKIAYVLKVGNTEYNTYDKDGTIIGGINLHGDLQSMSTNGDTFTISILDNGSIHTYTYDINNVLQHHNSIPAPKIQKQNNNIHEKIVKPSISAPINNDIKTTKSGGVSISCCNPKDTFLNPVKNNISRFIHLINFLCLSFLTVVFTLCVTTPENIFVLVFFIYSFLWYGHCCEHPCFNWRKKMYALVCLYIMSIIIINRIFL